MATTEAPWTEILNRGDGSPPTSRVWTSTPSQPGFFSRLFNEALPFVKAETAADTTEFYVIAKTVPSLSEAKEEVRRLAAIGQTAEVVKSSSGVFGVSVARAENLDQANDLLLKFRSAGKDSSRGYLMPRSRVAQVEEF